MSQFLGVGFSRKNAGLCGSLAADGGSQQVRYRAAPRPEVTEYPMRVPPTVAAPETTERCQGQSETEGSKIACGVTGSTGVY
jgi:hypothetical protein